MMLRMKRRHPAASVLFGLMLAVLGSGCGGPESPQPAAATLEAQTNPNLRHFGFALIDVGFDDPLDRIAKTNYSDEVAGFTNLADILVTEETDDIRARVRSLNGLGLKVLVHLSSLFFVADGSDAPSGADYKLRSDYRTRWARFQALNAAVLDPSAVQVLYLGEEPTWSGITFDELKAASDLIKAGVPDIPIMLVEAHPIVNQLQVPASIDWIGIDHYFLKHPKTDPEFRAELATLKAKRSRADQKLVLVMDTFYIASLHAQVGISESDMGTIAAEYYSLAVADHSVAAVIGYVWPGGFDDPRALGARQLPAEVRSVYREMGRRITGR